MKPPRTRIRLVALSVGLLLGSVQPVRAENPTEDSLIQAWEEVQKSDPQTLKFEKIEERRYRFATKRFPFDGEMKVLNAVIDDRTPDNSPYSMAWGYIEYELPGLSNETREKYQHSYAQWEENNRLYYVKKEGRWLTAKAYSEQLQQAGSDALLTNPLYGWGVSILLSWGPMILLTAVCVFVVVKVGRSSGRPHRALAEQQRAYTQKSYVHIDRSEQHMQRIEQLLERVALALENQSPRKEGAPRSQANRDHQDQSQWRQL